MTEGNRRRRKIGRTDFGSRLSKTRHEKRLLKDIIQLAASRKGTTRLNKPPKIDAHALKHVYRVTAASTLLLRALPSPTNPERGARSQLVGWGIPARLLQPFPYLADPTTEDEGDKKGVPRNCSKGNKDM